MTRFIFAFVLLYVNDISVAQNILINGSFEDYEFSEKDQIYPTNWNAPNTSTVDYYSEFVSSKSIYKSVRKPCYNINECIFGCHQAFNGKSFIGLALLSWEGQMEHFKGQLAIPMQKDSLYQISFSIKYPSDIFWLYSRKFEVVFTQENLIFPSDNYLKLFSYKNPIMASLVFNLDSVNLSRDWVRCSANYKAVGGESYIIFGLFGQQDKKLEQTIRKYRKENLDYPSQIKFVEKYKMKQIVRNPNSKMDRKNYQRKNLAYYFIDDIRITPIINSGIDYTF